MSDDQLLTVGHKLLIGIGGAGLSAAALHYFPVAIVGVGVFGEEAIRNLVIFAINVKRGTQDALPNQQVNA